MGREVTFVHPYMPNSVPKIRKRMLEEIGAESVEEIYKSLIPDDLLYKERLDLPEPIVSEYELRRHVMGILGKNITTEMYTSFLGAGCYRHQIPAVCDELNMRGEFLTAYCGDTYSDHGKMQAIFEYASMMGELLDTDVVSYTTYDAGQSVSSALRIALRVKEAQGRPKGVVLVPSTMNPEIYSQAAAYCRNVAEVVKIAGDQKTGRMDLMDLEEKLKQENVAAVFYENPSYLGFFEEQAEQIASLAHRYDALCIAQPETASLGIIESPVNLGADILCGDIQPLGMHMQFGGGQAGFIACQQRLELMEQFPTYMYGITKTEQEGRYGFGRAMNYRCSHGSRENAREYFGTETGLWGITAGIYLASMGPQGMYELGAAILQKTAYAIKKLSEIEGITVNLFGGKNFQEFVINFDQTKKTTAEINKALLGKKIFGGKDISRDFPQYGQSALYCISELTTEEEILNLREALAEAVRGVDMGYVRKDRDFHEARWDEPIIMEMGNPGERGVLIPPVSDTIKEEAGSAEELIPDGMRRKKAPALPEMSQMQVLRHYMRLSQETIGTDINIDIGLGTCTMKYSPKINEQFVRAPELTELHPYQDESTIQGILEIMYRDEQYIKAISGMDRVSLQPSGGSQAIFANVETIRAYHEANGEGGQRDEIITTILSHPGNPGAAATLGYKVITLYPDKDGLPDLEALKAAVSERTAALMITNPEDTGIYNDRIRQFVDTVHEAGGLCVYDQANLNGVFGITRARDAGFDMCHYNLHKSFSSPHGCQGPAAGAHCVCEKLARFVAAPTVEFDGEKYYFEYDRPDSIGKLRKYYGVPGVLVRTYAYIRSLGPDGMKQIGELSILNNNYMLKKLLEIPGLSMPMAEGRFRMEQARLSWEKLTQDTGVTTDDICRRIVDYGFQDYFASHHPRVIPEPFTPEPVETYSKDDIDEFVEAFRAIAREAYTNPELVKTAPHKAALGSQIDESYLTEWSKFATTWRAYKKYVEKSEK